MRLALLGLDDTTLALADAAQSRGHDEIVLVCDVDDSQRTPLDKSIPLGPWEALLSGAADGRFPCDAVLVARDSSNDETRLEQLRKLVQAGVPMLLSHPLHNSMLAYYELDMIRRESGCPMLPFLPARMNPLAQQLAELVHNPSTSPLGHIDQIALERAMVDRSKVTVSSQFSRDVDLLRLLGGEVSRLGAMGSPGATAAGEFLAYNNLGVQMAGGENRLLRWSVGPVDEFSGAKLTATGARGKAIMWMPEDLEPWRLEIRAASDSSVADAKAWNPYVDALDALRAAQSAPETPSHWPDAARAVELTETIERSLKKGRTIELHQEQFSDASTFKGTMTSVGCALLLAALLLMVAGVVAANMLKHAGAEQAARMVGAIPYLMLAVFVLFLATQLLLKLARSSSTNEQTPDNDKTQRSGNL
jgi:myo-inositol 2-dehydrogenase/D-chiro-inositol 1-dehydrogenase